MTASPERSISAPEVEERETGYLVTLPMSDGLIRLNFEDIGQAKSHVLEADLTVWQEIVGVDAEPFSGRLNLLSLSARETYRRLLDDQFGKITPWTAVLNRACGIVKQAWETRPRSMFIENAPMPSERRFALMPLLLERGATIWFGDGGVGKTTVALWAARELGVSVLYLDYEWEASEIRRIWQRLEGEDGRLRYWNPRGVPVADEAQALMREARTYKSEYLIIDSAALACGGEPEKAEPTTRMFNALQRVGLPALIIAHITKAGEDRRPYGNTFWHNSARMTWNVKSQRRGQEMRVGFLCRKPPSNGPKPPPLGLLVKHEEDRIGVTRQTLWAEFKPVTIADEIRRVLATGNLSTAEIAAEIGEKHDSVYKALCRMSDVKILSESRDWALDGQDPDRSEGS